MIVNKEDQEKLIKRQMKSIDNLQEIINLLKFDLSQIRKENQILKYRLKHRKENIKNIRVELISMKRNKDYSNINNVLAILNEGWEDEN